MENEAGLADHLRTSDTPLWAKCLPDHKVARLRGEQLHEYFAPCLAAIDLDTDHGPFDYPEPEPEPVQPDGASVYFIEGAGGAIKIGHTTQSIKERMKAIQNGSPVRLRLLAFCSGGVDIERAYHRRFAEWRLEGEWFTPHPTILSEIARLAEDGA